MLGTQILLGSDSVLVTWKGPGQPLCVPGADRFTCLISFTPPPPSQNHGQCYYDPCVIKEEPRAQEGKQVAQGHTKTTCRDSSPVSSGAKAQGARCPLLPPPGCAGLGWQKAGLSRLGVVPVLSMGKTCSGTSPGSGLCSCVVCTRLLFSFSIHCFYKCLVCSQCQPALRDGK